MQFNSIEEILEDIRSGKMVIITDDESRENEGDLVFAAQHVDKDKVNFMARYGRGLICVPLDEERLRTLGLQDMVESNEEHFQTAFTVSVDAAHGITTGISAYDRAHTIKMLADPSYGRSDLKVPGHIFPLKAKKGGVLIRAGHTEAGVDLSRLAGLSPASVICEIMNDDGSMARLDDLEQFAEEHNLKIGTIAQLIEYRRANDKLVEQVSSATLPTRFGEWKIIGFRSLIDGGEHVALIKGAVSEGPTLVRVHSECFTGDVLTSLRCDCQSQLYRAMEMIEKQGSGVLLYLRQEGRGIGLLNKIKAYDLQDQGYDTVEANERLGFKSDLRTYGIGAQILADLGLRDIRLITNNPRKIVGLEGYHLNIIERVSLEIKSNKHNEKYLKAKKDKLGHLLDI